MDSPKPNQHYKISLQQAKRDYQDGIITAAGLVFYAIGVYRKPGNKLKIPNVESFCRLLGINPSTFYKVISKLRMQRRISWEATDGVNVWLLDESPIIQLIQDRACQSPNGESESPNGESESPNGESESPNGESESPNGESESPNGEFQASKPTSSKSSRLSSDSYQLFLNSLSNSERENFINFLEKKIAALPNKPVLPQKWVEKFLEELKQEFWSTEGNRRSLAMPDLDQIAKLQQLRDTEEIYDFYPSPYKNGTTIVVDDGSEVLPWWEFFEIRDFNS